MFAYDMENFNYTEKRKNILVARMLQTISRRTESMLQGEQMTYYISISTFLKEYCRLFPEEEKACYKETKGTDDLLYINQHILKEIKTSQINVVRVWIDYKKAYDMVPQTWLKECLKTFLNIQQSHKLHLKSHEKLESGINSRRTNPCKG